MVGFGYTTFYKLKPHFAICRTGLYQQLCPKIAIKPADNDKLIK